MIDGAIVGVTLFVLGGVVGLLLARYHYLQVIAGQATCIEALEDYIDARSECEASAEELGYDD